MNPRIKEIVEVVPYQLKLRWTDGLVRTLDIARFLERERGNPNSVYARLFQPSVFNQVKTDGRTIYWDDLTEMIDENGQRLSAPLDFCPDVLYSEST